MIRPDSLSDTISLILSIHDFLYTSDCFGVRIKISQIKKGISLNYGMTFIVKNTRNFLLNNVPKILGSV